MKSGFFFYYKKKHSDGLRLTVCFDIYLKKMIYIRVTCGFNINFFFNTMEHDGVSCGGHTRSDLRVKPAAVHAITRRSPSDYACLDCEIALPGYEYGDERSLYDHIYVNNMRGGTCRYIQDKFKNDLKGFKLMLGTARFRRGYVAFPDYIFYGVYGYVKLSEIMRCVVCTTEQGKHHPPACSELTERLRVLLHKLKLHEPPSRPLFATRNSFGPTVTTDDQIECDGVNVTHTGFCLNDKFAVLGEKANMTYIYGTDDAHVCGTCVTRIAQFEEGDTLLREHVYHVYNDGNTCAYLERMFNGDAERQTLKRMVAEERHRKGFVAYADKILQCDNGVSLDGCVTCAAVYEKGFVRFITHGPLCAETRQGLTSVLRHRKLM